MGLTELAHTPSREYLTISSGGGCLKRKHKRRKQKGKDMKNMIIMLVACMTLIAVSGCEPPKKVRPQDYAAIGNTIDKIFVYFPERYEGEVTVDVNDKSYTVVIMSHNHGLMYSYGKTKVAIYCGEGYEKTSVSYEGLDFSNPGAEKEFRARGLAIVSKFLSETARTYDKALDGARDDIFTPAK
jgi:hypothetical protein